MKILIDARMYGLEHAGIGRYVMNLVSQLVEIDKTNQYILLVNRKLTTDYRLPTTDNWELEFVDVPHYSIAEQVQLPAILIKEQFDIAHFPHFNVPIFFKRPFVVTIHDLIKHTSRGLATTTRDPLLYWVKYAGYKMVFSNAVHKARKIIVPSNAVRDELLKEYRVDREKVMVIYEGADEIFSKTQKLQNSKRIINKYKIPQQYVIYAGSAYPHKNLERLIKAVKQSRTNLIIASARNVFTARLIQYVNKIKADSFVNFLGFVSDEDLVILYKNAKAFVFPSLSEGFGLPGLEAMTTGCPVVCSDIPVFHEIYGDAATYFNPRDVVDIASKINEVLRFDVSKHQNMVEKGKERAKQFSWKKMAEETLQVYKEALLR